jgi:hypothetical protein
MKQHNSYLFSILLILSVFLSCSKDKTEKLVYRDLGFDPVSVLDKIPAGLKESNDPYARMVYDDILTMLDWGEFSNQLTLPGTALKLSTGAESEKYQWSLNTGTLLLLIGLTFSRDGEYYQWQENIQYGLGTANEYFSARENKSGNSGSLDYNMHWFCGLEQLTSPCEPNYHHFEWTVHDNQQLEYSSKMNVQTEMPVVTIETRLVMNPDGSGLVDAYTGSEPYYSAVWDKQGNGSYTQYDGDTHVTSGWIVD